MRDLDHYLGELGHLVILREGDLAFLHTHPESSEGRGPSIVFGTEFPSAGRYRLFLEFAHHNQVQALDFIVSADPPPPGPKAPGAHGAHLEHRR